MSSGGHSMFVEHGREILLDVGLALVFPGELAHVPSPAGVGDFAGVEINEGGVVDGGAVSGSPGGLMMGCQLSMDDLHFLRL